VVKDGFSRLDLANAMRVSNTGETGCTLLRQRFEFLSIVIKELNGIIQTTVKVKVALGLMGYPVICFMYQLT
jgi:hypothetical protein